MDIAKSFSYQFEDRQWISKLGLGALISLVPVLNLALTGYMVTIIRNVAENSPEPLPNWDGLGQKLSDGLILTAAGLVYAAPILLVVCAPLGFLAAAGAFSQARTWPEPGPSFLPGGEVLVASLICLVMLYTLLLSLIHPVVLVIFSRDGTFASCFKLGEMARILARHAGLFSATWIVTLAASLMVGLIVGLVNVLAGWIPCLGWFAGAALGLAATLYLITGDAHLFGQFRSVALAATPQRPDILS